MDARNQFLIVKHDNMHQPMIFFGYSSISLRRNACICIFALHFICLHLHFFCASYNMLLLVNIFQQYMFCFSAALGWFAYAPEWYESQNKSFAQREAQSVSIFVHCLQNERPSGSADSAPKSQGREGEPNMVWCYLHLCSLFVSLHLPT